VPRLKKGSDPEVERRIAARLAELRKIRRLSQGELAADIGLTRAQLSNIELCRSPLRYVHATRALLMDADAVNRVPFMLPFNPLWLFGQERPIQLDWPILLPDPVSIGLSPILRFSDFVAGHLALLQGLERSWADLPESWLPPYYQHWSKLQTRADRVETETFAVMENLIVSAVDLSPSSPIARNLVEQMRRRSVKASNFLSVLDSARHPKEPPREKSTRGLTEHSALRNVVGMKSELQQLLGRVRELSKAKGAKAKLASFLEVSAPRVSEWLAGKYEPSGETTLRLFHWVEQQEAKQQSPDSVSAPPGPKTQSQKPYEKKSKSSPPKP
jgi:transcriptional regulator with XRE-family HTH domain